MDSDWDDDTWWLVTMECSVCWRISQRGHAALKYQ
jgi:hypothetical protein